MQLHGAGCHAMMPGCGHGLAVHLTASSQHCLWPSRTCICLRAQALALEGHPTHANGQATCYTCAPVPCMIDGSAQKQAGSMAWHVLWRAGLDPKCMATAAPAASGHFMGYAYDNPAVDNCDGGW